MVHHHALSALEGRCADNWHGVILAGADDLPSSLIEPWTTELNQHDSSPREAPQWTDNPFHTEFGTEFGMPCGERLALRAHFGSKRSETVLRALALARGVTDLRTIGERRHDHEDPAVPRQAWQGLLATRRLDLEPFEPVTQDYWRSGSDLPLGPLSEVQVYSLNADPRYEGKGHAPDCQHADRYREGLTDGYDLLTVADLLACDTYRWCSKCSGYGVRRLSTRQLDYYRSAHQLHYLRGRTYGDTLAPAETDQVRAQLQAIETWVGSCNDDWSYEDRQLWRDAFEVVRRSTKHKP